MRRGGSSRKRRSQFLTRESREEHFVLRVAEKSLAENLRKVIRQQRDGDPPTDPENDPDQDQDQDRDPDHDHDQDSLKPPEISLEFRNFPKKGVFKVGEEQHSVHVLDLPTQVECYKTLDDVHCVKLTDIGQILHVGKDPPEFNMENGESKDGVMPAFKNARERVFKPSPEFNPQEISEVEDDLLALFEGWAPPGCQYIDTEEQYVEKDGGVEWMPITEQGK